jgi:SAM-dependent methyltransferase
MNNIIKKVNTTINLLKKGDFKLVVSILKRQNWFGENYSHKNKWESGIKYEIDFWDSYLSTGGLQWSADYLGRLNPELPLQVRPSELLPEKKEISILDVGAGPFTFLGKINEGKKIDITAVDPLADEYDFLLAKYNIIPLVRTRRVAAEDLTSFYQDFSFDLVFARNCIDHSYNPEKAILQMIRIVRNESFVLLEHRENEAKNENYSGLHQWNFSVSSSGDFLISSKYTLVNFTQKYSKECDITCEIFEDKMDGKWLITRIKKNKKNC